MNIGQWITYGKERGYFDQARAAAIKEAQLEEMQALDRWLNFSPMTRMRRPELQKYITTRIRALKPLKIISTIPEPNEATATLPPQPQPRTEMEAPDVQ